MNNSQQNNNPLNQFNNQLLNPTISSNTLFPPILNDNQPINNEIEEHKKFVSEDGTKTIEISKKEINRTFPFKSLENNISTNQFFSMNQNKYEPKSNPFDIFSNSMNQNISQKIIKKEYTEHSYNNSHLMNGNLQNFGGMQNSEIQISTFNSNNNLQNIQNSQNQNLKNLTRSPNSSISIKITKSQTKNDRISTNSVINQIITENSNMKKINKNSQYYELIKRIAMQLKKKVKPPSKHGIFYLVRREEYITCIKKIGAQMKKQIKPPTNNFLNTYIEKNERYKKLIKQIAFQLKQRVRLPKECKIIKVYEPYMLLIRRIAKAINDSIKAKIQNNQINQHNIIKTTKITTITNNQEDNIRNINNGIKVELFSNSKKNVFNIENENKPKSHAFNEIKNNSVIINDDKNSNNSVKHLNSSNININSVFNEIPININYDSSRQSQKIIEEKINSNISNISNINSSIVNNINTNENNLMEIDEEKSKTFQQQNQNNIYSDININNQNSNLSNQIQQPRISPLFGAPISNNFINSNVNNSFSDIHPNEINVINFHNSQEKKKEINKSNRKSISSLSNKSIKISISGSKSKKIVEVKKSNSKKTSHKNSLENILNTNKLEDIDINDENFTQNFSQFLNYNNIQINSNIPISLNSNSKDLFKKQNFWIKIIKYIFTQNQNLTLFTFSLLIEQYFLWAEDLSKKNISEFKSIILEYIKEKFSLNEINQFLEIYKLKNIEDIFSKYDNNKTKNELKKEAKICQCELCTNDDACILKVTKINKKRIRTFKNGMLQLLSEEEHLTKEEKDKQLLQNLLNERNEYNKRKHTDKIFIKRQTPKKKSDIFSKSKAKISEQEDFEIIKFLEDTKKEEKVEKKSKSKKKPKKSGNLKKSDGSDESNSEKEEKIKSSKKSKSKSKNKKKKSENEKELKSVLEYYGKTKKEDLEEELEKSEKVEKSKKTEKTKKTGKNKKVEKNEKIEKSEKSEKSESSEKSQKNEKSDKSDRSLKEEKIEKNDKSQKNENKKKKKTKNLEEDYEKSKKGRSKSKKNKKKYSDEEDEIIKIIDDKEDEKEKEVTEDETENVVVTKAEKRKSKNKTPNKKKKKH